MEKRGVPGRSRRRDGVLTVLCGRWTAEEGIRGSAWSAAGLLGLRLAVGGLFIFAAWHKLFTPFGPQNFLEAIQAFRMVQDDRLLLLGTWSIPWAELVAGAALVAGLWSRAAALVLSLLLTLFIAVIVSAIGRGLGGITCGCFGEWQLFCPGTVGWCKVAENAVLLAVTAGLWTAGGGRLSADALLVPSPRAPARAATWDRP